MMQPDNWKRISQIKGYEGAGVIFIVESNWYVLGINKNNEAEYPGGKVEEQDNSVAHTIAREVEEETGLKLDISRVSKLAEITGGATGYSAFVSITFITTDEFNLMNSNCLNNTDGTFSKFIKTKDIVDTDTVIDSNGESYKLRKFNAKYIIPQIKESLPNFNLTV
jgi:8-oxo-dGTP pyrophosphatase MutT (NUDIX family)